MIYGFDFTDKICYMSKYDGEERKELPARSCPAELERRLEFIKSYLAAPDDLAVMVPETITKEVVKAAAAEEAIELLSKEEAFAEYVLQEEGGAWKRNTAVFEFHKNYFCFYEASRKGKVIMTKKEQIPFEKKSVTSAKEKDKFFTKWVAKKLNHRQIATVYLIGEEFEGKWMELSLASVCHGRRVFMGNHLFSTGAMLLKAEPLEKKEVLMTEDYYPYYWGIRAFHHGKKDVFIPIIKPGNFWFDTKGTIEVLMDACEQLEIEGMHSVSRQESRITIPLKITSSGLRMTKYRIEMHCVDAKTIEISIYNIGFGMIREGSGQIHREEFKLP